MYSNLLHSGQIEPHFSSSKKKLSTPSLLFCRSPSNLSAKQISQNDSHYLNTSSNQPKTSSQQPNSSSQFSKPFRQSVQQSPCYLPSNSQKSPLRQSNRKLIQSDNSPFIAKSTHKQSTSNQTIKQSYSQIIYEEESETRGSMNLCQNHQDRVANFVCLMDQVTEEYYCDKCAILLASQGYVVEKIHETSCNSSRISNISHSRMNTSQLSNEKLKTSQLSHSTLKTFQISEKNINVGQKLSSHNRAFQNPQRKNPHYNQVQHQQWQRREEVGEFLGLARGLLGEIEGKKEQIRQNLIQSEEFYGQQLEEVNEYFQLVYKSLELEKNKCYNYILHQRTEVQQPVRLINHTIEELKARIQDIIQDIEQNLQTVYQTADEIYRPVISQYQQNYEDVEAKIQQLKVYPVEMRKVDFEGVPQSIFQLSDLLRQSMESSYQSSNQCKMNEQLESLRQSIKENLPQLQPKRLFSKREGESKFCFSFQAESMSQFGRQHQTDSGSYKEDRQTGQRCYREDEQIDQRCYVASHQTSQECYGKN